MPRGYMSHSGVLRAWLQRPMQPTDEPRYSGARQPNFECGITTARATRTEMHSGRLARLGSNPDPDTMITRRWSAIGGCASALARSHPLLGEKECGLLCATSPSESSPSLTRARYAGTAGLPGPSQYPARYATPNCHLIDSRASGDNGGFALQPPPKLDGSRFLFCSGGMGG